MLSLSLSLSRKVAAAAPIVQYLNTSLLCLPSTNKTLSSCRRTWREGSRDYREEDASEFGPPPFSFYWRADYFALILKDEKRAAAVFWPYFLQTLFLPEALICLLNLYHPSLERERGKGKLVVGGGGGHRTMFDFVLNRGTSVFRPQGLCDSYVYFYS